MITDKQTNFVYISDMLHRKFPKFHSAFTAKLKENSVPFDLIVGTKDVWAADYMPIQIDDNKYVQFSYEPYYITERRVDRNKLTNVDEVCRKLGIKPIKSNLIVDGSNIARWYDKVLMTTMVFTENYDIPEMKLIEQLKNLLEVNELYFVPAEDWLGHVDSVARFIDDKKVLVNEIDMESEDYPIDFLMSLYNAGFTWETFPFEPNEEEDLDEEDATGTYLNYLELENHIFLPTFSLKSDDKAIKRAEQIFPNKKIIPVPASDPALEGGLINSLTWNLKR